MSEMIKFLVLLAFMGLTMASASFVGGGSFIGVVLLASLVGGFALMVTLLNEVRRVLS
jgi:hypothetical protein